MQTVLIVDDDEETRKVLQASLAKSDFSAFAVASGEEAVRLCRAQRIDLVLLDIWMPEKDGLETLMEIRRGAPDAVAGHRQVACNAARGRAESPELG